MSGLTDAQVIAKKLQGGGPQWPTLNQFPVEELSLNDWLFVRDCWEARPTSRPTMDYLYKRSHAYVLNSIFETDDEGLGETEEVLQEPEDGFTEIYESYAHSEVLLQSQSGDSECSSSGSIAPTRASQDFSYLTELAQCVFDRVTTVNHYLQTSGPARPPEQAREIDSRILDVVAAVRNLLYVAATPTSHIPSHLYPGGLESGSGSSSIPLGPPLQAAHRKVAGTLSKLILSALRLQRDLTSNINFNFVILSVVPHHIEDNAKELEHSVVSFVIEVQKYHEQHGPPSASKRLYGVYGTDNVGLSLPGAGTAASWKGFGYVATASGVDPPAGLLRGEIITALRVFSTALNSRLSNLIEIAHTSVGKRIRINIVLQFLLSSLSYIEHSQVKGQALVAYLSSLLKFIGEFNIAQHVDIDGLRAECGGSTASNSRYVQTVDRAWLLLRKLELVTQNLYDLSSSLFMSIQLSRVLEGDHDPQHISQPPYREQITDVILAISSDMTVTIDVLEELWNLGQEQVDIQAHTAGPSGRDKNGVD